MSGDIILAGTGLELRVFCVLHQLWAANSSGEGRFLPVPMIPFFLVAMFWTGVVGIGILTSPMYHFVKAFLFMPYPAMKEGCE